MIFPKLAPRTDKDIIIQEYRSFINAKTFPCIAAKAAVANEQVRCMVAGNMACPKDDYDILQFLYNFVDEYRTSKDFYHSAVVIFSDENVYNEEMFDALLWQRLNAFHRLDAQHYDYDNRVEKDPANAKFSFSIKQEALYIIGLHPRSSRQARQFKYPALVFNPHAQFEELKTINKYEKMKHAVRKRDIALSGSVNPMLQDFGESSEVFQYSGRKYDDSWKCPLKITDAFKHNTSA